MRALRVLAVLALAGIAAAQSGPQTEYRRRVEAVTRTSGFVALWDFVKREDGVAGSGRFAAHQRKGDRTDLRLDASNYVQEYWGVGQQSAYTDFPLLGRGPFGQAVRFVKREGLEFRPMLQVPRSRIHDSGLDAKGRGKSVSMICWMVRERGEHAVAGIWHEGTDLKGVSGVQRVVKGMRQYGIFTGLAGKPGGSAAHVSENGATSFGDRFARNMSVTSETIPAVAVDGPGAVVDEGWTVVAFSFDNARNQVTSYINGKAEPHWIEQPASHPFYQWPARGWLQDGKDPAFPEDQFYRPPEKRPIATQVVSESSDSKIVLQEYAFTKVKVTLGKDSQGRFRKVVKRELAALKVNPLWFGHDLFTPPNETEGGPFTIGEFVHSSRSQGFIGLIGGVAVFDRALSASDMKRLASIGRANHLRLTDLR